MVQVDASQGGGGANSSAICDDANTAMRRLGHASRTAPTGAGSKVDESGRRIAAVVVSHDTRDDVLACLETLAAAGADEVVLVDSGSRDATAAAVRERFPDVTVVELDNVGYGRPDVELVAQQSIVSTIRNGKPLVERVVAPAALPLPVTEGTLVGRVEVYDGNRLVGATNLVTASSAAEVGFVGKTRWYVTQTVRNAWEIVT